VDEPTIAQVLRGSTTAESATRELVDMALEQGGTDNVTVIVARYRVPFEPGPAWHLGWDHDVNVEH
jgi:serine/threonine protein phosphatase PrpC